MTFRAAHFALTLAFVSLNTLAQPTASTDDQRFLAAREAFRKGNATELHDAANRLNKAHPLAIYAENYRLRNLMARDDTAGIGEFLDHHDGSYVAERLRADWLRWLAKNKQWSEVDREFSRLRAPTADDLCVHQQARWALGDQRVLDQIQPRWLDLLEPSADCQPVIDILANSGRIDTETLWARARLQIEINRISAARRTLDYLPASQQPDGKALNTASSNAMSYLAKLPDSANRPRQHRELIAIAIRYLAANDPLQAATQLERRKNQLQASERLWAWSQIALQGARKHHPETLDWYAKAGNTPLSEENHQWKVRAALRQQAWGAVRNAIEDMPNELAARPEWVYWLGRSYKAGGRQTEAETLFQRIAGQAHFYGNLADEELGRQIKPPARSQPLSEPELQAARQNPALQRALTMLRLDMRIEGVREWNWALRGMSDRQLLAAAELARQNQVWDRAINTAERTREEHDYSLRFLAPFAEQIRPAARQQSIDDAWVYGLMRQESRFITNARSSVGASGLMQLMPATAKWVAKKIGLNNFSLDQVNDTEVNVLLGTSYMRIVMESLDNHPVLASAAYNAGPGRARRWRADTPLEGAIYAETIPFSETRDYVKKVMSNAVYYTHEFNGRPDSLKARLGIIKPSNNDASPGSYPQ